MLEANGVSPHKLQLQKNTIDMALLIADYMIAGVAVDCPTCESAGLVWCAGRVTCWGYLGGTTRCVHKAAPADVHRYDFKMPKAHCDSDWLQDWMVGLKAGEHRVARATAAKPSARDSADKAEGGVKMEVDEPDLPAIPGFDCDYIRTLTKKDLTILLTKRGHEVDKKTKVGEMIDLLMAALLADPSLPPELDGWKPGELQLEAAMRINVGLGGGKSKRKLLAALQNPPAATMGEEGSSKKRKKTPSAAAAGGGQEFATGGGFKPEGALKVKLKAPTRKAPEAGSEILKVHDAFSARTGRSGRIVVGRDKVSRTLTPF